MMKQIFIVGFVICTVCMGCTSIPDVGTRAYVYERVGRVQLGNTTEQVQYLLSGPPSYVTSIRQGGDNFELWEYRVGNFLYSQTVMILFKNGRVIAMPKHSQDVIGVLYSNGIVRDVEFWDNKNN